MIYTITPNPALDLGGIVDAIIPNEKTYVQNETRFPGGNAINAARIITRLQVPAIASGFLGGAIGNEIKQLLDAEKVYHHFIPIRGNTRINITLSNLKSHFQTRISFPGPHILPKEIKELEKWLTRIPTPSLFIIGGSLPLGFEIKNLRKLIQIITMNRFPCVVDMPGHCMQPLIDLPLFLIKPNLIEFQQLIGKSVNSLSQVVREAQVKLSHIPYICVSSVEGGAVLLTQKEIVFGKIPKIKIQSTVGAGDSMVGAICARLWKLRMKLNSLSAEDLLRWGLAASAATLAETGTTLGSKKAILGFLKQIEVTRITNI